MGQGQVGTRERYGKSNFPSDTILVDLTLLQFCTHMTEQEGRRDREREKSSTHRNLEQKSWVDSAHSCHRRVMW